MNRRTRYLVIVIVAVCMALGALLLYLYQQNRQKNHVWFPTYRTRGMLKKEPYGLYYFREILEHRGGKGGFRVIRRPLPVFFDEDAHRKGTYLLMGYAPFYTADGVEALFRFAGRGNNVFMAVNFLPDELIRRLRADTAAMENPVKNLFSAEVDATLPTLAPGHTWRFRFRQGLTDAVHDWSWIDTEAFTGHEYPVKPLGFINGDTCTFMKVKIGKGALYIHSNPIFFTNYHLITDEGYRYASGVFSFLDPDEEVYFDTFSLKPTQDSHMNKADLPESWLQFIISSPGLSQAWYLLVVIALLFVAFRSRRRQRPIPVTEPNANSTLEYVKTIGGIYLKSKDHKGLALQQKQLFFQHLSAHYGIRTNQPKGDLVREIAGKANLPEEMAGTIMDALEMAEGREKLSGQELFRLHEIIQHYYTHTQRKS